MNKPRAIRDPAERFWAKVDADGVCWEWTGVIKPNGYGSFMVGRRSLGERRAVNVHRFAYELLVGPIPEGLQIDHLCRNRRCCDPDHMQLVSPAINTQRGWRAQTRHCKRGHALTPENTYRQPSNGRRSCKVCRTNAREAWRSRELLKGAPDGA